SERSGQYAGAVTDSLNGVLSAVLDERSTNEGDGCNRIKRSEFADAVGDINFRLGFGVWRLGPQLRLESKAPERCGKPAAAFGMARHDDRQQAFDVAAHQRVCRRDHRVFAGMRA